MLFQGRYNFLAQFVPADGTHGHAFHAELAGMISEIGGRTTQFLSLGKHVPKRFPYADDESIIHNQLRTL